MSPIAGPTLLRHDTEAYNALEPSIPESTVNDVEHVQADEEDVRKSLLNAYDMIPDMNLVD